MIKMYTKILSIIFTLLLIFSIQGYTTPKDGDQINLTVVASIIQAVTYQTLQVLHANLLPFSRLDEQYKGPYDGFYRLLSILQESWIAHTEKKDISKASQLVELCDSWILEVYKATKAAGHSTIATRLKGKYYERKSQFLQAPYKEEEHDWAILSRYKAYAKEIAHELTKITSPDPKARIAYKFTHPMRLASRLQVTHIPLCKAYETYLEKTNNMQLSSRARVIHTPLSEADKDYLEKTQTLRFDDESGLRYAADLAEEIIYIYLSQNQHSRNFQYLNRKLKDRVQLLLEDLKLNYPEKPPLKNPNKELTIIPIPNQSNVSMPLQ